MAGDLAGTAAAPTVPGLALKENLTNKSTDVTTDAASDTKYPSVKAVKTYVDAQVAGATIADASATEKGKIQLAGDLAGTAAAPTVPGLALKAPIASPTFTGTVTTGAINTGTLSSTSITAPTYASTPIALTYTGSNINWNPAQGLNAAITLTQNSGLNFTAAPPVGSYGTVVLTQDATGSRTITLPTIAGATNKVLGSTSTSTVALSTVANSKDILNFYFDGTSCYWNIGQGYGSAAAAASSTANLASGVTGTLPIANGGTGATTASAALTSLGAAPIASPTFTGTVSTSALSSTSITAPTYASTPIALTYTGTNINWNPALGLNAAITLTQNSGLNFTAAPPVGSYGTVVLTQDATGNRTITLPSIPNVTNKVLGSTSTSTVALSTVANSKDILNFYFDGTSCYWNIGQGYGAAATAASSTANLASGVTGTLPIANGGTGATTATAALASLGGAPLASPTFTGTVTAPIYASTPQLLTDGSTITWNPSLGLNASVTLGGNRTLSFSTTPVAGAYGTLVVTQDGIGSRTLTLPSTANKVLGSISTTTIALSTAAGAKDIINFYYDGTNCYWNIGQGYGSAANSAYQAPLTLTTTGTGAATLSGTTLNIPTPSSGGGSIHTIGEAYGGGIVFYVYDGGKHGLIAATADQSAGVVWDIGSTHTRAKGNGIGAGLKNTPIIITKSAVAGQGDNSGTACNEYSVTETVGGVTTTYGDWYLPSKYELELLYLQRSVVGGFTSIQYWSSTEETFNAAWIVDFRRTDNNPGSHTVNKGFNGARVRAIRAF